MLHSLTRRVCPCLQNEVSVSLETLGGSVLQWELHSISYMSYGPSREL